MLDITSSSKYSLLNKSSEDRLNMTLIISNLNEHDDQGTYWCQGFLLDGTMLSMSNSFHLTRSMYYVGKCADNLVIKSAMSSCAPFAVSTPTASAVTDTSSPMTTDEMSTTPFETETSVNESQNVSIPTLPSDSGSKNPIPTLYIIIGMVGFLSIMCIALAFIICFLCKRVTVKGN